MVCDKVVCDKDGVWQSLCVTKLCVKDGVWQSCVRVTKMCVKMVCDKDAVCECETHPSPTSTTPATQNKGRCHQVPRLPRETTEDVRKCTPAAQNGPGTARRPSASPDPAQSHKCHACHAKRRWMSPSATPATWSGGNCHEVPRLPRKRPRDRTAPKRVTRPSPVP